jgi:Amt family ammonium transporter
MGALDFAGGTVVHVNAGVAALVAAMVVGQRKDFARQAFLPHNVPFVLLGAGLLWFGWFGFNAGSALAASPSRRSRSRLRSWRRWARSSSGRCST